MSAPLDAAAVFDIQHVDSTDMVSAQLGSILHQKSNTALYQQDDQCARQYCCQLSVCVLSLSYT